MILAGLSIAVLGFWLCQWLAQQQSTAHGLRWLLGKIYCPLFRSLAMLLVLLASYPAVFQLEPNSAIPVLSLLHSWERWNLMINLLFFSSLFLPWVPVLRHRAISLPVQTLMATALLFSWWAQTQTGLEYSLWPNALTVLTLLAISFSSWWLLPRLLFALSGLFVEQRQTWNALQPILLDLALLVLQIPLMQVYGQFLFSNASLLAH